MDKLEQKNGTWSINSGQAFADRVFLVTGSHPKDDSPYPKVSSIALDDALIPSKVKGALSLCNLSCLATRSHPPELLYWLAGIFSAKIYAQQVITLVTASWGAVSVFAHTHAHLSSSAYLTRS